MGNGVDNTSPKKLVEAENIVIKGPCCSLVKDKSVADIFRITSMCSTYLGSGNKICKCGELLSCKVVVVTALSGLQYEESLTFLGSTQFYLPNTPIIVHDLGLSPINRESMASFCNVHVRDFKFDKYPPHVKNLTTNAWKPIIIAEMSKIYEVVLWCDSKCRVKKPLWTKLHYLTHYPIIPVFQKDYPFINTLHENTKEYLGLTQSRSQYSSISISLRSEGILWLNEELRKHLLLPWLDCALHVECIAPNGSIDPCSNSPLVMNGDHADCHGFDQAAYNAILTREYGMKFIDYISTKKLIGLTRTTIPSKGLKRKYSVKSC